MLDFYRNEWHGSFNGTEEELSLLLSRAADAVNNAIILSGYTVDSVPEILKQSVCKAVCAQADYIESQGGVESLTEGSYSSVTLGRFSYSDGTQNGAVSASGGSLCILAKDYLESTGLLYRGVAVY
ncbi:MAG: hypothetical protein IKL00_12315 [Oscillospiraceae bacterium]|nr:hypothetical protein [Oscillospiraceae bacterium]